MLIVDAHVYRHIGPIVIGDTHRPDDASSLNNGFRLATVSL